jgi:RNA recognition motif-containing protein
MSSSPAVTGAEISPSPGLKEKLEMSLEDIIKQENQQKRRRSRSPARSSPYERPNGRPAEGQNRRVYVGNIAWTTKWGDLKDHMKQIGPVDFADVFVGPDGRSRGCGVVEFTNPEDAARAIKELTDTRIGDSDRMIFVREDREKDSFSGRRGDSRRSGRDDDRGSSRGSNRGREADGCKVVVENLSFKTDWKDLKDYFRSSGRVVQADVLNDRDGRSSGRAIVLFESASDARRAIEECDDREFMGRRIRVREDRLPSDRR